MICDIERKGYMMIAKQIFDDVTEKISETIANSPVKDMEKNAKALLSGTLSNKLDLVTRDEYETQQQILIKTRVKLAELETRVMQLEQQLARLSEKS